MKTKFFLILFLTFISVNVQIAQAQSKQTQKINIYKQKKFSASKLNVKFISLIEDSRCPEGVDCLWAGNAKIKIEISNGRTKETFEINTNLGAKGASFDGYAINLTSLTPAPKANVKLNKNSYQATFAVSRLTR